jgi:hypothetical protein
LNPCFDTTGSYLGSTSPAHDLHALDDTENWWNGTGIDQTDGQFFWASGAPATNISIDFGSTTNNVGGVNLDWDAELLGTGRHTGSPSGVYNTFLMRDWCHSNTDNDIGVRLSGFEQGHYKVYALIKEFDAPGRTYDVYFGINIDNTGDVSATQKSIAATSATTWIEGENYVSSILTINSESDYLTVLIDATNSQWAIMNGLQIIKEPPQQGMLLILK